MSASAHHYMGHALRLAKRGLGQVWPNPAVGCVIVKDTIAGGQIIGRGWTQKGGRPHAEAIALAQAGAAARGATLYVTLEPCCQPGRGPACTGEIIKAGITKVVIALGDPDPRVNGQGIEQLKAADIEVTVLSGHPSPLRAGCKQASSQVADKPDEGANGLLHRLKSPSPDAPHHPLPQGRGTKPLGLCQDGNKSLVDEATTINKGFFLHIMDNRPLVTLKLAVSQDWKLTTGDPANPWITGTESRRHAHWLRATHDAILVGINTVLTDDPRLNCRLPGLENRSPVRVVLDRHLRVPLNSQLVQTAKDIPLWVVTKENIDTPKAQQLISLGVQIIPSAILPLMRGEVPKRREAEGVQVLQQLSDRGITRLMIEGGAQVAQSFLDAGFVDEIALYQAPHDIGEAGLLAPQLPLETLIEQKRLGDDIYRHYVLSR